MSKTTMRDTSKLFTLRYTFQAAEGIASIDAARDMENLYNPNVETIKALVYITGMTAAQWAYKQYRNRALRSTSKDYALTDAIYPCAEVFPDSSIVYGGDMVYAGELFLRRLQLIVSAMALNLSGAIQPEHWDFVYNVLSLTHQGLAPFRHCLAHGQRICNPAELEKMRVLLKESQEAARYIKEHPAKFKAMSKGWMLYFGTFLVNKSKTTLSCPLAAYRSQKTHWTRMAAIYKKWRKNEKTVGVAPAPVAKPVNSATIALGEADKPYRVEVPVKIVFEGKNVNGKLEVKLAQVDILETLPSLKVKDGLSEASVAMTDIVIGHAKDVLIVKTTTLASRVSRYNSAEAKLREEQAKRNALQEIEAISTQLSSDAQALLSKLIQPLKPS